MTGTLTWDRSIHVHIGKTGISFVCICGSKLCIQGSNNEVTTNTGIQHQTTLETGKGSYSLPNVMALPKKMYLLALFPSNPPGWAFIVYTSNSLFTSLIVSDPR